MRFLRRYRLLLMLLLFFLAAGAVLAVLVVRLSSLQLQQERVELRREVTGRLQQLYNGYLQPALYSAHRLAAQPAVVQALQTGVISPALPLLADSGARLSGADFVALINRQGRVVYAVSNSAGRIFPAGNYKGNDYFRHGLQGKSGFFPGMDGAVRGVYTVAPVLQAGAVSGIAVFRLPVGFLEKILGRYPFPVFILSPGGTVFASNQPLAGLIRFQGLRALQSSNHDHAVFSGTDIRTVVPDIREDRFFWRGSAYLWVTVPVNFGESGWRVMLLHPAEEGGGLLAAAWIRVLLPLPALLGIVVMLLFYREVRRKQAAARQLRIFYEVVEQSPEAILVTDSKGRIEFVNRKFELLTGYDASEVLGLTPAVLKSGRHDDDFYRELWSTLLGGGQWNGEFINRRKDGTIYVEHDAISPVLDDQGRISNYISIKTDITRQKDMEKTLKLYATKDQLTGVLNRHSGMQQLEVEMEQARKQGTPLSVGFADLDRLKQVNDTLGHSQGDKYICLVASCMQSVLRQSDTIARLGGDEFLLIMPGCPLERAAFIWERIEMQFSEIYTDGKFPEPLSVSCGMVALQPGQGVDELLEAADAEMYRVKQSHRSRN